MNNLKCLKQGFNKLECKIDKTRTPFKDCVGCPYKEYKSNSSNLTNLKSRTSKQAKLERNRTSLFTDDLDHCIICGKKKDHLHEVFFGSNRKKSMMYGMILPLCFECHKRMHSNIQLQREYKKRGQVLFEKAYSDLKFEDVFRKNYK